MAARSIPRTKLSPDPDPGKDMFDCVELKSQHNNSPGYCHQYAKDKKAPFQGAFSHGVISILILFIFLQILLN
jgi:hypothetical protein